jgi:hypothetical protein
MGMTQRLAFFLAALMLLAAPACHVALFNPSAQEIRDDELAKQVKIRCWRANG